MENDKNTFLTEPFQEKVPKPWGEETLYAPAGAPYAGKILFVKGGKKLSLQYHSEKRETLCLFSGNALLWVENSDGEIEKISMRPFSGYSIVPGQQHRIEAIEDSFILEASTPETGDTVRVEDDYSRPTETEDLRKQKNRGWNG
jgi:mannose-6-phosphate isomerase